MAVAENIKLIAEEIKPKIGSRVYNNKQELLSGKLGAELKALLEQRGVLVFPEVHFTDDEQVVFTKTIGTFVPESGDKGIYNISLDKNFNENPDYLKGASYWHIDSAMSKVPIGASILCSKVLASWGGNTEFCNTYAAYDDLSDEKKTLIESLKIKHAAWNTLFFYDPEPAQKTLEQMMQLGATELPMVWTHNSGRKSLVLGCTAHHIVDEEWIESARLLNEMREWATSEPFHYAHEWKVGDAVMWDNTGTMHRARPYDPECGRLLQRTKTEGEEAIS